MRRETDRRVGPCGGRVGGEPVEDPEDIQSRVYREGVSLEGPRWVGSRRGNVTTRVSEPHTLKGSYTGTWSDTRDDGSLELPGVKWRSRVVSRPVPESRL